jgi:tetratricopeptide (TPR) repeat protein
MMALDTFRSRPWAAPLPYFDVARSLIQLGQLDEAKTYLDKGKEILLKTGDEFFLLVEYYVDGLLEMAEGRPQDAMQSFERSLEICDRIERQRRINQALRSLVECEVALFERTPGNESDECSGVWMERLEEEIEEKDIPGIEGRLLLLKAKLRIKQGRKEEAETLLNDVRRLAENPHVRYLADRVTDIRMQARILDS